MWTCYFISHFVNIFSANFVSKEDGAERDHISSLCQARPQFLPISGCHQHHNPLFSGERYVLIFFADPILVQDSAKADANVL